MTTIRLPLIGTAVVAWSALSLPAQAMQIEITPSSSTIDIGETLAIDVVASGLGNGVAPSIGAYDIQIDFDTALLSADPVDYGTGLDLGLGSLQLSFDLPFGVEVTETAYGSETEINGLQPDDFVLFSVNLSGLAAGTGALGLTLLSVTDASGVNDITSSFTTVGASYRVPDAYAPIPGAAYLFGAGLVSLVVTRRRSASLHRNSGA